MKKGEKEMGRIWTLKSFSIVLYVLLIATVFVSLNNFSLVIADMLLFLLGSLVFLALIVRFDELEKFERVMREV